MKRLLCFCLIFCFCITPIHATEYYAKNYIVMNADTLQVLEGKEIHQTQSVASISKIMTAIVAIENCELSQELVLNESISKAYGSAVYIHIGDTITLQDLLYALLLRSGNDAALAIADYVGQGVESFVEMMNQKARELGMDNTHFNNPSGLDEEDDGNISSVYDMALLMSYCINNPIFAKIVGTQTYRRLDRNGSWTNKNKLLTNYDYCIGGKTGYTKKAKRTLVNAAQKDGITLVCVTFNCGDDFSFQQNLFETYFNCYKEILLFNKGTHIIDHYKFTLDEQLTFPAKKDEEINVSYHIQQDKIALYANSEFVGSYSYEYLRSPLLDKIYEIFKRLIYE